MTTVWGPYGDNITTDQLYPSRYSYLNPTPEDTIPHLLEGIDENFAHRAQPGDVILGRSNFGSGPPLYHPAVGFKALGITIIAASFARIFFRTAINHGVRVIACPRAVEVYQGGNSLIVDFEGATITIEGIAYSFRPYDPYVKGIIAAGGLLPFIKEQLREHAPRVPTSNG